MTRFAPDGDGPVEWLFLNDDTPETGLADWLENALPHCGWSGHVVLTGDDAGGRLLETVVDYLEREEIALIHLHQVIASGLQTGALAERLMTAAARFQNEAYRERTGSRLVPLPILEIEPGADPRPALDTAADLAARLAKPSLLLWDEPDDPTIRNAAELGLRLYLGSKATGSSTMEVLTAAHVLDGAVEKLAAGDGLLGPCKPHLAVAGGRVFGCAQQWLQGRSDCGLDVFEDPTWQPDTALCPGCIADTIAASGPSMIANQRRQDGRELALRASSALVDRGAQRAAAQVARTAAELSLTDEPRAEALIQAALCDLSAGRLQQTDTALVEAASNGAAPGLIAYHRARVQVAWRDDIVAIDHFAEALEHGTDAVSVSDLHFEMALSHIRLEEWADARAHLLETDGDSAAVEFNLGVCDVNDDEASRALVHFDRALELGPPGEDLGRVRFFRGFCLKELERYEEAADDLRLSIELEEPELAHHNSLGFCLFKLGRHDEAVACFERAVDLDPGSAVDWANIGVNLERLGHTDRAREMYRKALGLDRSIGFAWDGLKRVGG